MKLNYNDFKSFNDSNEKMEKNLIKFIISNLLVNKGNILIFLKFFHVS